MTDEPERRVYRLSTEYEWAYLEDLLPARPDVPRELLLLTVAEDTVDDVDDLGVDAYGGEPEFYQDDAAVEATAAEVTDWNGAYGQYKEAQQDFRQQLKQAKLAYEASVEQALAELTAAADEYRPWEEAVKARSRELAARLHAHREAGRAYLEKKQEAEEAALDAQFGPRVLVLYPPKDLDSYKKTDHVARVHLVGCKHRRGTADNPVRAKDAVERLSDPANWPQGSFSSHAGRHQMRVKMCSFCKPWTVLMEHAGATTETFRGQIKLEEWPEALTLDLRKAGDVV